MGAVATVLEQPTPLVKAVDVLTTGLTAEAIIAASGEIAYIVAVNAVVAALTLEGLIVAGSALDAGFEAVLEHNEAAGVPPTFPGL